MVTQKSENIFQFMKKHFLVVLQEQILIVADKDI